MTDTRPLAEITIGHRHRRDLGDLQALAASIERLGLLQPIVIKPDGELIAGRRRLEAFRILGRETIDVRVAANITEAAELLAAERDENRCRKPMVVSELLALAAAIEAVERPKAAERLRDGQRRGRSLEDRLVSDPQNGDQTINGHESRWVAAKAVGLSCGSYGRLRRLADAAAGFERAHGGKTRPVSDERADQARTALALIDRIEAGETIQAEEGGRPLSPTGLYHAWNTATATDDTDDTDDPTDTGEDTDHITTATGPARPATQSERAVINHLRLISEKGWERTGRGEHDYRAVSQLRISEATRLLALATRILAGETIRPRGGGKPLTIRGEYRKFCETHSESDTRDGFDKINVGGQRKKPGPKPRHIEVAAMQRVMVQLTEIAEMLGSPLVFDQDIDGGQASAWKATLSAVSKSIRTFNNNMKGHADALR